MGRVTGNEVSFFTNVFKKVNNSPPIKKFTIGYFLGTSVFSLRTTSFHFHAKTWHFRNTGKFRYTRIFLHDKGDNVQSGQDQLIFFFSQPLLTIIVNDLWGFEVSVCCVCFMQIILGLIFFMGS